MPFFDRLKLSTERKYTDEGFLSVPARISRIGIQEYRAVEMGLSDRDPNDIIRVYRPEEEVFNQDSLDSFTNKPVTNNHPPELVNTNNSRNYTVGLSGHEAMKDGMFVKTSLTVTDSDAIKAIESGKVELSNGYTADIDWTPGVTQDGEEFDAVQRNIKGNHIAIVERGRAGPSCRVADNLPDIEDEVTMPKITIDGVDYEVSEQAAQAVGKLQSALNDAESEAQKNAEDLKEKEDEMEEVKKEAKKTEDSLQAKLDDAESRIPDAKTLDSMASERADFIAQAKSIHPDLEWEGKDSATIKREVVALKRPNVQMDSKSEDYVDAAFDILLDSVEQNSQQSLDDALTGQVTKDNDSEVDNRPADVIAREKMMADSQNAWKRDK